MTERQQEQSHLSSLSKARLKPTETFVIPVHPSTEGTQVQRLAVEKHVFAAPQQPAEDSIAYVWSHANGFHKEMLHPLMRRCLTKLRALHVYQKTDITFVAFDARNQGDSALSNIKNVFIADYGWVHHALDTIQVIETLELKKNHNKVIGVGHSFGGCAMMLAEFLFPRTFDGLCMLEAVAAKVIMQHELYANFPTIKETLNHRPFWRDFHPEVFQNYVDYGLYDTPDGHVKLKCSKEHEHHVYLASHLSSPIAYNGLKTLSIPLHMVHADLSYFMDPSTAPEIKALSPWITSTVVSGTHMVPGENPDIIVPEVVYLTQRVMAEHAKL
ncbi:Alpha/Beta hydrolase protein [Dichotomocladium elegans]|nr:Alpha/Beta hydrolase protein [Dichotomocladium elegans]